MVGLRLDIAAVHCRDVWQAHHPWIIAEHITPFVVTEFPKFLSDASHAVEARPVVGAISLIVPRGTLQSMSPFRRSTATSEPQVGRLQRTPSGERIGSRRIP